MRIVAIILLSMSACGDAHPGTEGGKAGTRATTIGITGGAAADSASLRSAGKGGSAGAAAATTGSAGGAAGESSAMGTASTWVADLTAAYCTWAIRCGKFPNAAVCKASMGPEFALVNFNVPSAAVTAVSNGTARFDAQQAASCMATLSSLDCDVNILNLPSIPEPCLAAFSGSVADGDACVDDVACAKGSMCVISSTAPCQGKCTPASGGSGCRTNEDCTPLQFCAGAGMQGSGLGGSGLCQTTVAPGASAGDPCGIPVQCAPGLSCIGGPGPARCGVQAGEGEHCGMGLRLRGPSCTTGLVCVLSDDAASATCMVPAKLGDPCTSLFQCGAQYGLSDIICDEVSTHTCVHKPSSGPCIILSGINTCNPVTGYCDGGTCKPWLSHGASCTVLTSNGIEPCGPRNRCQDGTCTSQPAACIPE